MLTFRQPGDMARYVADNDPGQIAAGFSNLEDFLAAGNKIPEYKLGREPLQQANPMSGAQQATPSTPTTNFFQVTPPSVPISEQTPMSGLSQVFSPEELVETGQFLPDIPKAIRSPGLPQPTDPVGLQDAIRTVDPIVSGPQGIETNKFQGFDDRLTKIEEGIASLLQNRGQQFNFGMQPRFNMSGLGYFFNPQGGFYG